MEHHHHCNTRIMFGKKYTSVTMRKLSPGLYQTPLGEVVFFFFVHFLMKLFCGPPLVHHL